MGNFDPMSPFKMSTRIEVEAAQWTGDNLDEMKRLLVPYVEGDTEGPFVYSDYVEPYYFASYNISGGGYNMLKFGSCGGHEVDPGQWVVVYDDGEIEVMDNEQFQKMGFK
jgi:hypothetical protein